jgi:hypothetical protein
MMTGDVAGGCERMGASAAVRLPFVQRRSHCAILAA